MLPDANSRFGPGGLAAVTPASDAGVDVELVLLGRLVVQAVADRHVEVLGHADRDLAEDGGSVDLVAVQPVAGRRPGAAAQCRDPTVRDEVTPERPTVDAVDVEPERERRHVARGDVRLPSS